MAREKLVFGGDKEEKEKKKKKEPKEEKEHKEEKDTAKFDPELLLQLLNRVYLGGLLEECVLNFDNGVAFVQAVDMTSSIYLYCESNIPMLKIKKSLVGFGDLGLLCKFLSTAAGEDMEVQQSENRVKFYQKGRTFEYLLSDPKVIPTSVDSTDAIDKIESLMTMGVPISETVKNDYQMYMGLTGLKVVTVIVSKGYVTIRGGGEATHQFEIEVGKALSQKKSGGKVDDISLNVYGNHLNAIMQTLEFQDDEKKYPVLLFCDSEKPLVVKQDQNNLWALTPIDKEGEEGSK